MKNVILPIVIMAMSGPVAAQTFENETPAGLQSAVVDLTAQREGAVLYGDIDQDGEIEAVISYADDCNIAGCLFSIVDEAADGTYGELAYQYGMNPALVDGVVIDASGVFWIWDGADLLPYYSLFDAQPFDTGSDADVRHVLAQSPWLDPVNKFHMMVQRFDLIGDGADETFIFLPGIDYAIGNGSPYFIFTADGELIDKGASQDVPALHRRTDVKSANIITSDGQKFTTKIIE